MKTAISIPDAVFEAAERLARRLGISRSELYARAVPRFVEEQDQQSITDRLDEIHAAEPGAGTPDAWLASIQARSLDRDEW